MDQGKQTNPDRDEPSPLETADWNVANTTPSINPDVALINRTLP